MPDKKKVVIIVPTYNERENIRLLTEIIYGKIEPEVHHNWDLHVLVVDDNSPDGTAREVKKLQQAFPKIHLLINPKKAGLGNAYIKGMEQAITKMGALAVMEMDADLQHDPTKIPPMLAMLDQGYEVVLGSRYISGGGIPRNWGWYRKFLSVVGNLVIRLVIGELKIHDWTGGFRAIEAKVVKAVLPSMNREMFMGYTFQIGFLHQVVRRGYKVGEVPFVFKDRRLGKSKLGAEYIKIALFFILKTRIKEIITARGFKFALVGSIGALVQLLALSIYRMGLPFQVAFSLAIETAIVSNFIWSNVWTFRDRKLQFKQIPGKFIQFNLASVGSILIQEVVALLGERWIGLKPWFNLTAGIVIDTGMVMAAVGIILGMLWNYLAYDRWIWTKK